MFVKESAERRAREQDLVCWSVSGKKKKYLMENSGFDEFWARGDPRKLPTSMDGSTQAAQRSAVQSNRVRY